MTDLTPEAKNLKNAGVAMPIHPERANEQAAAMTKNIASGDALKAVKNAATKMGNGNAVGGSKALTKLGSGSVGIALDKRREPMGSLIQKGIPHEIEKEDERIKVRQWTRKFYATHNLMSTAVDIYTQFPIQGIEVKSKDPEIQKFYETLFFDQLNYEDFLEDFGREYWTVGEVNSLGNWNETLGVWDREQILNPDDIKVFPGSIFDVSPQYYMKLPETIKKIIQTGKPQWEFNMLNEHYPEIVRAAKESGSGGNGITGDSDYGEFDTAGLLAVNEYVLSRTVNRNTPWDSYGTPHMLRAFSTLIMEESLNAAQDAVADRLYSPLILAKLGIENLGDNAGPWIPGEAELDQFTGQMQTAFAADFRFLAYHFGIDIKSVFGKETLPNFDNDYSRLERKMLQVWGIGEGLISGSNAGSYASSALNREFVTQLMSRFQKKIEKHFKQRCEIVAEAQEHFDYDLAGGVRTPIYEEVVETDPNTGDQYIVKRPKLLLPTLSFATMNLRDEVQERAFLQTLRQNGVPISDNTLMVGIDIKFEEEVEKISDEKIQKVIAEQETKQTIFKALTARGLPIPAELAAEMAAGQAAQPGADSPIDPNHMPGTVGRPTDLPGTVGRPDNLPDTAGAIGRPHTLPGTTGRPNSGADEASGGLPGAVGRPSAMGSPAPALPGVTGRPESTPVAMPGVTGRPDGDILGQPKPAASPASPDNAIADITSPAPAPDIAPTDPTVQPDSAIGDNPNSTNVNKPGFDGLPKNRIKLRPEISDEQRKNSPKKANNAAGVMRNGPSTRGIRSKLTPESVENAINDRLWEENLPGHKKKDD